MDSKPEDPLDSDAFGSSTEPDEDEHDPPWHPKCEANNCENGSVELEERPDPEEDDSTVTGGICNQCGTPAVQCAICEGLTVLLHWDPVSCACGETVYQMVPLDKKGISFWFHRVS